mmetsp:Transcript_95018/g.150205  ORF Transcript_95018/g.150205 Transcript_95018/m.150205 type:complete len:210 (+) Transcript_95018:1079-1708(+)
MSLELVAVSIPTMLRMASVVSAIITLKICGAIVNIHAFRGTSFTRHVLAIRHVPSNRVVCAVRHIALDACKRTLIVSHWSITFVGFFARYARRRAIFHFASRHFDCLAMSYSARQCTILSLSVLLCFCLLSCPRCTLRTSHLIVVAIVDTPGHRNIIAELDAADRSTIRSFAITGSLEVLCTLGATCFATISICRLHHLRALVNKTHLL